MKRLPLVINNQMNIGAIIGEVEIDYNIIKISITHLSFNTGFNATPNTSTTMESITPIKDSNGKFLGFSLNTLR